MKNTFLFIRHGESLANAKRFVGAQNDVPLTEKGRQQAEHAALDLQNEDIAQIISSNLIRAKDTANIIAATHNIEIEIWPGLNEVNAGKIAGTHNSIKHSFLERSIAQQEGESLGDLAVRANNIVAKLEKLPYTDKTVVIVGHNTFTSIIFATLKGLPKEKFLIHRNEWHMDNAKGLRIKL